MSVKYVEIVSVGNELLIGKTLNTNAQWLAKRITSLGLSVSRITVAGDTVDTISRILQEVVSRMPSFIIVTGGLGPTFDDKTLEGLAKAFSSGLKVNEQALKMVKEKYAKYAVDIGHKSFELTPARVKMATIPEGAEPLPNPVGTAPGISFNKDDMAVYALPGIPSEMKAIFEESILPVLRRAAGDLTFFEASLFVEGVMESEMAPLIDRVMHDNPLVYVKSHPMGEEGKPRIELHLSTMAEDRNEAVRRVDSALAQLLELAKAYGGKTAKAAKDESV